MSNLYEYINAEKLMKFEHDPSLGLTKIVLPRSGAAVRKMTPGLFYVKPDLEMHTKVEENSHRFPTVIYKPSNGRRFMRYDFWTTTESLKTVLWTDYSVERKLNYGPVRMGFFPWAE
jgi:hypothetical protein